MVRRIRRVFAGVSAAMTVAVLVATTAPAAGGASSGSTVRIGVEAPLSGSESLLGQSMLDGAQLAAKELNGSGGIAGKQVEIVPIDDAADPATGVSAARAAIASGLDGVVGPYNSGVGAQTLPLYLAAGLVPIRLTSDDSTNGLGFTLQPMTYQYVPVITKAMTAWERAKSVAIVYDESALYTQGIASAVKSGLEASGVRVAAFQAIQPGRSSYASVIRALSRTKPDVIYLAAYYPEAGLMAKEMSTLRVKARCLADAGAYDLGFINAAGKKAAAQCPVVGVPAAGEFPGSAAHVAAYRALFHREPGTWTPYTYDSVKLFAYAVGQAGSFDAARLTSVLNTVREWPGWTGTVSIDASTGNRDPATIVVLVANGPHAFRVDSGWQKAVHARSG